MTKKLLPVGFYDLLFDEAEKNHRQYFLMQTRGQKARNLQGNIVSKNKIFPRNHISCAKRIGNFRIGKIFLKLNQRQSDQAIAGAKESGKSIVNVAMIFFRLIKKQIVKTDR